MSERVVSRGRVFAFGAMLWISGQILTGDAPVESHQDAQMAEAAAARSAIAQRYAGCVITEVVDTRTSEVRTDGFTDYRGLPTPAELVPRNKVVVTAEATITPESTAAEARYANGTPDEHLVRWYPFGYGAVTDIVRQGGEPDEYHRIPIPNTSTSVASGPNQETFTVTIYPRTDERRTTSSDVSLFTYAETYDTRANNGHGATYEAAGRISCGSIAEVTSPDGPVWQPAGPTEGIPASEFGERVCLNVPTGPSSYVVECQ